MHVPHTLGRRFSDCILRGSHSGVRKSFGYHRLDWHGYCSLKYAVNCKLVAKDVPPCKIKDFQRCFIEMKCAQGRRLKVNWVDFNSTWSLVLCPPPERVNASDVLQAMPTSGTFTPPDVQQG
jgi:hypothetical protein